MPCVVSSSEPERLWFGSWSWHIPELLVDPAWSVYHYNHVSLSHGVSLSLSLLAPSLPLPSSLSKNNKKYLKRQKNI